MSGTYSSFEAYSGVHLGEMDRERYEKYARMAKTEIDRKTFGRAADAGAEMAGALEACECELADVLHAYAQVPGGVRSVRNDGYTVEYGSRLKVDNLETVAAATERVCRRYLCRPVNLMYGGAGR